MTLLTMMGLMLLAACASGNENTDSDPDLPPPSDNPGTLFIADHTIAHESVLRKIPKEYIDKARKTLHISYQHTSHGTHVSFGLYGLQDFKKGDSELFGITLNEYPAVTNKLDFIDYQMSKYGGSTDLSSDETGFESCTRAFLDDPKAEHVNVIMWSWCSITNHDVANNYLPGMQRLIDEFGVGGTKVKSGKRKVPVTFIFMTGHAEANGNVGKGKPKDQADLIIAFCNKNKQYCLDYYNIDTHDMDGNYWEDAGDDGNSKKGGNFYADWQKSKQKGEHWFENKNKPGGQVTYGSHTTQHITSNRKAYAMWWILARIAGWNGELK